MSLNPLLWPLAGYLVLQILLNLSVARILVRKGQKPQYALVATFWCGVINALYFIVVAVLLHIWQLVPSADKPSGNYGFQALLGLPAGAALWYVTTLGRKLGKALFGKSELIAAETRSAHSSATTASGSAVISSSPSASSSSAPGSR